MAFHYGDPIVWAHTRSLQSNLRPEHDPERSRVTIDADGKRVIEKIPQSAHVGGYDNPARAPGRRSILVCRHEGHLVHLMLTNAAAHLDLDTTWARYQKNKALAFGWFPWAGCPVAMLRGRTLKPGQIVAVELLTAEPCPYGSRHSEENPCEHAIAERAARLEKWSRDERERWQAFEPEANQLQQQVAQSADAISKLTTITEWIAQQQLAPTPDDARRKR